MPETGLQMTLLGVTFMKGNCSAEEISEFLNINGDAGREEAFHLWEPRKLMTRDLVQEKYPEYHQVPDRERASML